MPSKALEKRVARLENVCAHHDQGPSEGIFAKLARLTPEERRARLRTLTDRLVAANGMEPTLENRARAVAQLQVRVGLTPTDMMPVLARIYGPESRGLP